MRRNQRRRQKGTPIGPLYAIHDRIGFAALLNAALQEAGENQKEAAERATVAESQISKLLRKELGAISEKTLQGILKLFPENRRTEVAQSLLSPAAVAARTRYEKWLEDWIHDFHLLREPGLDDWAEGWTDAALTAMIVRAYEVCRKELDDFWDKLAAAGHVAPRDRPLANPDIVATRYQLALYRVLEPFGSADDTAGFEVRFDELSDEDFRRFVKYGLERELILLDRAPDVQRAQQIGGEALPRRTNKAKPRGR